MYKTRNDLAVETRATAIRLLGERLSDSIDLMHQANKRTMLVCDEVRKSWLSETSPRAPPGTRSSPWREAKRVVHGGDVRGQIDRIRKEQNADGRVGQPRRIVNPDIARQPGAR
jgi:hypothetical protein